MTYRLDFDGVTDGPEFMRDEEDAHVWAALHRPGEPYSVTAFTDGRESRFGSVQYEPSP